MLVGPLIEGAIKWKEGEAQKYYPYDVETVHRATNRALEFLQIPSSPNSLTPEQPTVYISAGDKKQYHIKIYKTEKNISEVKIRINFMGNKPYAELIYAAIDEQLNTVVYHNGQPI